MIIGPLFLLGLYVFPLWNIMLGAPQYPEPLGMNIFIDGIKGVSEFDIQNIDGLNHYIGMRTLRFFEKVSYTWFMGWFVLMSILGVLGMYDFNAWMVDYGTNLDPNAIMKLTNPDGTPVSYKPPLFGHVKMLNFDVTSLPSTGAWLMFAGMMMTIIAFFVGKRSWQPKSKASAVRPIKVKTNDK